MRSCVWLCALVLGPASAWAGDLEDDLSQCAAIKRDRARLACFDDLASRAMPPPPESVVGSDSPALVAAPASPPAVESEPPPPPTPVQEAPTPPSTVNTAPIVESAVQGKERELFGFESQMQTTTPDEIRSRYVGEFTGWSGRTLFRLENGQVWKQTDNAKLVWQASNPVVTIRKGAFGTFRLGIEGVNKTVKVKRVK